MSFTQTQTQTQTQTAAHSTLKVFPYPHLKYPNSLRLVKLQVGSPDSDDIDIELVEINPSRQDTLPDPSPPTPEDPSESQIPLSQTRTFEIPTRHEPYEAVSYNWGTQKWTKSIRIRQGEEVFSYLISPNLHSALKAFRYEDRVRTLWIDAISIDQSNVNEKNYQVPMMAQIYGAATNVLIWLGDGDKKSILALDFIKNDVLKLWDFDKLCEDTANAPKWDALISLMKRPWFSRRWVVQEIVLANQALLQVGSDTIKWQDFADAVALFVEVETATHRLSEVMKKDPAFYHIPDFFGDVRSLGATLLVEATSNLYRKSKDGRREPLLSLEYLVSSLSVFEASEPRDTIFALLAIAKDTQPKAALEDVSPKTPISHQHIKALGQGRFVIQPYSVDYNQPFIDICKDFVNFSIRKADRATALDILCRPWAPKIKSTNGQPIKKLPSWIPDLDGAAFAMHTQHLDYAQTNASQRVHRRNADPLVGLPSSGQRVYQAAGSRAVNLKVLKFKPRNTFYSMHVEGFVVDEVGTVGEASRGGQIPCQWLGPGDWNDIANDPPPDELWRTLVADRGQYGQNAPPFYTRACQESFKRMVPGNPLNTKELIDEGRCTIVAQFLRRVQAVIWNRILLRTQKGRLALVHETAKEGDLICILYGCSVPVVLRKIYKSDEQIMAEQAEDKEVLRKAQKDAVDKIQTAYIERRARIRGKMSLQNSRANAVLKTCKQLWKYARHVGVAALAIYFRLWDLMQYKAFVLIFFVACVLLLEVFPWVLEGLAMRAWMRMRGGWPRMAPKKPKPTLPRKKEDGYYKLIGPCYVHGIMNGEAIELQNRDEVKAEVFELR